MTHPTIAFIGGGNMASSLIGGLLENGHPASAILATARSEQTRSALNEKFGIACMADNSEAAKRADVVVLAVKPQMMRDVCSSLTDALDHQPLIVSVAAGITTDLIGNWLGGDHAIVRCMPNTPSQLHCGASGLFANSAVSAEQRKLAETLLSAVGIVEWVVNEDLMDAVTAIAGSGPAYYFLIMELMEKVGIELGLNPDTARQLTIQTALGAAKMAAQGDIEPAELRARVTSKKGTTDRAITTFLKEGLEDIMRKGITGARDRGRELAIEMSNQS
ncbi:pyrroline-5-carboxylate reductase [Porticoccaceae bacterium LTM1]|nr:pyrroline-5-carboxylate reductase [Porticoccaceae bacterium LTM1]